ncbi:hypothetical protein AVEN_187348-1 [Araneus ventricosus]|uniref:Uncharacterized protein n=1 Tax=Araneus ventricosus TaxID=182803 RepID=A0A4Y2Q6G2_ARAVE|nr:hypothetical protein AVEN_187348-1 [Araneus ventricosus]
MSDSDFRHPSEHVSSCVCPDSVQPTAPACSPVCRRTRSQVAKRAAISQQFPSSPIEICSAANVVGPPATVKDTALDFSSGINSKSAEKANLLSHDQISGICTASSGSLDSNTELDTAPNMSQCETSALIASPPPPSGSLPNFSIGDCPIVVSDSLIIHVMMNEIIDIVCNDLLASITEDCASYMGEPITQFTLPHVEAPFQKTASRALQMKSFDEITQISPIIVNFANEIVDNVFASVFAENYCLNRINKSILNEIISVIENAENSVSENAPVIENAENFVFENVMLNENVNSNEIAEYADPITTSVNESSYNILIETVPNVDPVNIGNNQFLDNSDVEVNQTSLSFVQIIDSKSDENDDVKRGFLTSSKNCYIDLKRALLRRSLLLKSHENFDVVSKRGCEQ